MTPILFGGIASLAPLAHISGLGLPWPKGPRRSIGHVEVASEIGAAARASQPFVAGLCLIEVELLLAIGQRDDLLQ
ncbi:hypothetical protein AB1L30_00555, partial [Bremerella sp. JC817]